MFITFEGIDGCGKSTQVKLLGKFLWERKIEFIELREPGGTKLSEKIRTILLDNDNDFISPSSEFLLYSAARSQLVDEVIRPQLAQGKAVICDRFFDSSTAYQGYGRGLDIERISNVNSAATGGLTPDLTIVVDISIATSFKRRKIAGKSDDRIESEPTDFFERVRGGFLQLATIQKDRVKVVNGEDDIDTVRKQVEKLVIKHFNL